MRHLTSVAAAAALLCASYVGHAQPPPAPRGTAAPPSASASPPPPASTSASAPLPPPPPPLDSTASTPAATPPPPTAQGAPPPPPPYAYPYPPPRREEMEDEMPYKDGYLVPPGYHVETRTRRGPVIAGAVMFGAGYAIAAAVGASAADSNDGAFLPLFIPVVGPFITVGATDWSGSFGGVAFILIGLPLILDGLLQTAGVIAFTAGMTSPKQVLVRDGALTSKATPNLRIKPSGVEWRF